MYTLQLFHSTNIIDLLRGVGNKQTKTLSIDHSTLGIRSKSDDTFTAKIHSKH